MERLDLRSLESVLGIVQPWTIKSVEVNEPTKTVEINLDTQERKGLFGLRDSKRHNSAAVIKGRWQYLNLGQFRCFINAQVAPAASPGEQALSRPLLGQNAFLGHPQREYSNFLRQQIAIAQLKGMDIKSVAELYKIDELTYQQISDDLSNSSQQIRILGSLPTEVDPVWEAVLYDKLPLDTEVLPLKLLLSKLKASAASAKGAAEIKALVQQLRKFFIENASILEREMDQVCGIVGEKQQRQAQVQKSKQRLVLPPLKSSIWLEVLSGKLKLNSQSVPLNLLISRQRSAFIEGPTKEDKIQAIETLREYFRKNHRTLKPELLLLNRAMTVRKRNKIRLPNPDHEVWQHILSDDTLVPSDNMAYKLLLAKLRAQITHNADPVVKLEAARRVRDFLKHNHKTMRQELNILVKQTAAV